MSASRTLSRAKVQEEIACRVQHEAGVTREFVQGHLLRALDLAAENPQTITTVCRELAELAGLKILKHEDVTELATLPVPERQSRIAALLHVDPQLS